MKKLLFGTMLLVLVIVVPIPTMAAVNISVNISLPPPIVFEAPPEVVVIPDTDDVYVDPDIEVDLFFWNGWWWRLWEGRWYRSHYYDQDWGYYDSVPSFYFDIDPGWREYYRNHDWHGHPWNFQRIPNRDLNQHWRGWHNDKYWQKQETWGVRSYQPQPQPQRQQQRQQRQQQYQHRPEVQQHQQWRQQQQRQPQLQKPQGQQQRQPQVQQPKQQQQQRQPQAQQSQHSQPQGKPEGGEGEHRK